MSVARGKESEMSRLSKHHEELTNGVGKCSVPMWSGGCPSGFCDKPAYSGHRGGKYFVHPSTGKRIFFNGAYGGYVPALACPGHGGKTKEEALNLCSYCSKCIADCDNNPKFGCGKGDDNVCECDHFEERMAK